jgi:hypothetical protein
MTCDKRFYMVQCSYYLVNFGLTQLPQEPRAMLLLGLGWYGLPQAHGNSSEFAATSLKGTHAAPIFIYNYLCSSQTIA